MSNSSSDYDYNLLFSEQQKMDTYLNVIRMQYIIGYIIICTLGLALNFFVIIAGSCYCCNSDTAKWVLALAVTHLIFSAFLPLQILYSWYHFNWHYGRLLCKLSSYVVYVSLFSTAGILTLWSVNDTKTRTKCKGKLCTSRQHSLVLIMILCSWTFAMFVSIPSLFSRKLRYAELGEQCVDDFDYDVDKMTKDSMRKLTTLVCFRFLFGILFPAFLISTYCCCQGSDKERILRRIKCSIKLAYFVCWTPVLTMAFLQAVTNIFKDSLWYALPIATALAAAHCCVNPIIYLLVSQDIKMQWMKQSQGPAQSPTELPLIHKRLVAR